MKEFENVLQLAEHLLTLHVAVKHNAERGLERALQVIQTDAEQQIGHYQEEVGPYPAWAPLAERTEAEKARLGYPTDAPLLREGNLAASFQHEVQEDEGVVGSTDPVMVYHEFGTLNMPPRAVLGSAAFRNMERVQKILGRALVTAIVEGEVISGPGSDHFGEDIK